MSDGTPEASEPHRILVVDDDVSIRDMLQAHLVDADYEVEAAEDGYAGLAAVEAYHIDLVLLDINMPGLTGLDVLRLLRSRRSRTELPVIVVSTGSEDETVTEALRLGANDYVVKPVAVPVLLARIRSQLSFRKEATARVTPVDTATGLVAPVNPYYCDQCISVLTDDPTCGWCGAPRREEGWPRVDRSGHVFLGRTLHGRYYLDRFVGAGASGEVYRVSDLHLKRTFAAKVVRVDADLPDDEELRRSFEHEVDALARLQNPHVVKLYDVFDISREERCFVSDFVEGFTLQRLLGFVGTLSPPIALDIVRQTAQGLYEAHQLDLVHRDVKPANVMIEQLPAGGRFVRILDFGLVGSADHHTDDDRLYGTPLYAAPEQLVGGMQVDRRADIYSLGAVLFHMLTGQPPYAGPSVSALVHQHQLGVTPQLADWVNDLPDPAALQRFVDRMLATDARERFQDLVDVIRTIDRLHPGPPPA